MRNLKTLERLQQIHNLILIETTGTPKELASMLKVSDRSLYLLLDQLKAYNACICYCRKRKTYYYLNDFEIQVFVSVKVLSDNEVTNVFGGSYFLKSTLHIAS
jgi:transcriptional antiterminator